jgi:DNA-binding NarL/FixJ family response regulator
MTVVGEAGNGHEAIEVCRSCQPDVLILDLRMPGPGGIEVCRRLKDDCAGTRIAVVTTYSRDEFIFRAVDAGVMAYLVKDVHLSDLVETIRAVAKGESRFPPHIAARLAYRENAPALTRQELQILNLIVQGKSNKEIGGELLPFSLSSVREIGRRRPSAPSSGDWLRTPLSGFPEAAVISRPDPPALASWTVSMCGTLIVRSPCSL